MFNIIRKFYDVIIYFTKLYDYLGEGNLEICEKESRFQKMEGIFQLLPFIRNIINATIDSLVQKQSMGMYLRLLHLDLPPTRG